MVLSYSYATHEYSSPEMLVRSERVSATLTLLPERVSFACSGPHPAPSYATSTFRKTPEARKAQGLPLLLSLAGPGKHSIWGLLHMQPRRVQDSTDAINTTTACQQMSVCMTATDDDFRANQSASSTSIGVTDQ